MNNNYIKAGAILFIGFSSINNSTAKIKSLLSEKNKRPNILYIMSDDHCVQGIGVSNCKINNTNSCKII